MAVTDRQVEAAAKVYWDKLGADNGFPTPWDQAPQDQILPAMRLALEAADEAAWQPIGDAPRDGTAIILFEQGRDTIIETGRWRADKERWVINNNAFWVVDPTHFRPLHPPPSGRE